MKKKVPCPSCGNPKTVYSKLCYSCSMKKRWGVDGVYRHRKLRYGKKPPKYCLDCGKEVSRYAGTIRCQRCNAKTLRGSNHWRWKGGRAKSFGYIYILKPEHPRSNKKGYVAEHLLVWEQTHNKALPQGLIIHHLNGIKDDNRPENLVVTSPNKHNTKSFIQLLQSRIRELEQLHLPI